jgi:hypothetical protein
MRWKDGNKGQIGNDLEEGSYDLFWHLYGEGEGKTREPQLNDYFLVILLWLLKVLQRKLVQFSAEK